MKENYIANVGGNRELYKKAYLIEFQGEGKPDVFTFSVPPKEEELNYTQRKTETKTFGGLHVDEYGIDAVKIVLSGSTVNQELKMIYGGERGDKWLTGEEEIYYLRDLITKYKTGVENIKRKIIIYDLSKTSYTGEGSSAPIKNYWQAFPGNFKIRRSSDRPFTYNYSFEFTGVPLDESSKYGWSGGSDSHRGSNSHGGTNDQEPKEPEIDALQAILDGLIGALDFIDRMNGRVNNVLDKANQVSKLIKVLGNVMSYSAHTLSGIIDSFGDTATGFIDGAANVVSGARSVVSLPRTIQLKALNLGLEIQNATTGLMKEMSSLSQECRDMFTGQYWEIPQEVLDQYAMSNEEFKDSVNLMLNQAENITTGLSAAAKSSEIPDVTIGNPDPATGEQRIVLSYGYTTVMLKSTDSLESLAKQYFGDPDKAIDIATYNGIATLSDLNPGDIIRLPITKRTPRMKSNHIFSRSDDRDNYGRDIMLTDDGCVVSSTSGDYAITKGPANLAQAVLLRLRESSAKRIRLNAYGIRKNIGDPTAGIAYIVSSIELTVKGDPRVLSVDDIRFSARGDYMNVSVDYSDINKADGKVSGRV
jgi:hypothetical protein